MIEIEVKGRCDAHALAELIAATLHGHIPTDTHSPAATTGKLVREQQEEAERRRPSRDQIETVNFVTIDPENDWSDL